MEELQSWWEVPTIAHFCSLFRAAFSLLDFDIEELEEALLNEGSDEGNPFLTDLIVRLLSGCYQRTDLNAQNYQKYLIDFVKHHWAKEQENENILENKDFSHLSLRYKVEILHALCDARLDSPDVADVLKNLEADSLRVEPLGRDESGATYWYFYGTRLYKEAQISEIEIKNKEKEKLRKKKEKEKEKKRKRRERKKRRGKGKKVKDRKDKKDRRSSSSESDSDEESSPSKIPYTGWQVVCSTEEEWKELAERFKKSKNRNEKELYRTLTVDFLPEIGRMIIEREKQQKKKSIEFAPRRSSQRIERLRQQREEEERLVAISLVEEQKRILNDSAIKTETDKERREREARQREERLLERQIAREERARRVQLREERARLLAEGKELPPHLQNSTYPSKNKTNCNVFTESEEDIYVGMYKVFEILKNHRDAWPFAQPVDEEYAPGYYDIVKQPMDLSTIEKNLQQKIYCSKLEFENDVMQMLDNCRKYNGMDSDYTKMSKNLQFAFEKAMQRFFPPDSSDDDFSGGEELETTKPIVGNQITKPLNVKGIEVLARVAEQALQNSSQRSKPYTLTIANVHPATFSNASVARSIENSSKNKNVSLCMINVPSDRNSVAGSDNSSNQSKSGIKQRFQQILYSSGKEINKDSTGKRLNTTTIQDKKAKISGSLDAMSKMVDGLPEKQKRSILNFTAIYQASLIARTENKNESAIGSNSEVKNEVGDSAENNASDKVVPAASNSESDITTCAETVTSFEQKGELLTDSKIKTEDKFNSKLEVQCNNNQAGTKNIVILNSSAFSNANIPVNSNILVLHNAIPVSAISSSGSVEKTTDKNNTPVSNSPVVYCQLATGTTTTSSAIPNLTVATSDSGNNFISASSTVTDKSLNLPNNAIPVKKRAYLSVETNATNTTVPSSNGFKKDVDSNKRKIEGDEKGENAPLMKLQKSETVDKNGPGLRQKNGLQPQHVLSLNSVVVNTNSSKEKKTEVINCGKTSVITSHSSVTKSSSPLIKMVSSTPEVVEGLAGKLQQQQSCPSITQELDTNKKANDSSIVKATIPISTNNNLLKGYVHLPRGVSPAAENFAQKLTMDVSGNVSNNCVRLGTQVRNKTAMLMNTSIPNPNNSSHQQTLRLQPKIATTQNSVNHVVNNVMIANYTSPQTTIAVQPQQPPVQYSICIGQNRINTSSSGGTTAYHNPTAVPISTQSHCEKLTTAPIQSTHIQLNSGLNDSKQTIISPQLQYVDQSGIRYTALPANLVPLTVRTEQAQPQQVFYVQQQGQMVIQPQLLTQHYQPTSHNVTSQPGFGSPKTIITMPAVPQQTFLATQPQSLSTPVHNGTSTHYYTVLPHHPMT